MTVSPSSYDGQVGQGVAGRLCRRSFNEKFGNDKVLGLAFLAQFEST